MGIANPIARFLQRLTLRAFADWRVEGRENVPPSGSLIVVSNHQSNFDPSLLSTSFPRRVSFLAKKSLFKRALASWFLRSYGAFPLEREGADINAYRWALGILANGQTLVVFPEGTRSLGRGMRKGRRGVASLALKSGAVMLPVGITGTEKLGTIFRVFNPTGEIRVNIGPAFSLPEVGGRPSKEDLDSFADIIMYRIAALLPPEYRGVYNDGPEASASRRDHSV